MDVNNQELPVNNSIFSDKIRNIKTSFQQVKDQENVGIKIGGFKVTDIFARINAVSPRVTLFNCHFIVIFSAVMHFGST